MAVARRRVLHGILGFCVVATIVWIVSVPKIMEYREVQRQRHLAYSRDLPIIVPPNCTELRKITPHDAIVPNITPNKHTKPRGVIVYLLVNEKNTPWFRSYVKELYYHLQDIWLYYNHQHNYTVIVFYDETVARSDIDWLNRATSEQNVVFSDVTRVKREFYDEHVPDPDAYVRCMSDKYHFSLHSMNYVFMNYWRIKGLWDHPLMKEFDYYLSIDSDMYPIKNIEPDPIQYLHDNDLLYGYITQSNDPPQCVAEKETLHYVDCLNITPTDRHALNNAVFHGAFQVGRIDWFRSAAYQHYADYILSMDGLTTHRWSDQSTFRLALLMFSATSSRVHQFSELENSFKHDWAHHLWIH